MEWMIRQAVDLSNGFPPMLVWPNALMLVGDSEAHRWDVIVTDCGKPIDLSGYSAHGYFVRDDGESVFVDGMTDGNIAEVILKPECYAVEGPLRGVIRLTKGKQIITACEAYFVVRKDVGDKIIDPGNVIPSLDALLAQMEKTEAAIERANFAADRAENAAESAGQAAESLERIDDSLTSDDSLWSSRNIVERLCPEFERSGGAVYCHPVEGYPMKAISHISGYKIGFGDPSPDDPHQLIPYERVVLYRGSSNMLDMSGVTVASGSASITNGMIEITDQSNAVEIVVPVKIKKGIIHTVWCRAEVYGMPDGVVNATSITISTDAPAHPSNTTSSLYKNGNWESALSCGLFVLHSASVDTVNVHIKVNRSAAPMANVRLSPMVAVNRSGEKINANGFETYRGEEFTAELGQLVYSGSFNWQTGELTTEWEHRVLDGTENWRKYDINPAEKGYYYLSIGMLNTYVSGAVICSHWTQTPVGSSTVSNGVHVTNSSQGEDRLVFRPDMSVYDTLDKWNAFLAEQYEAGRPVAVAYQRMTPKTVQLEPLELLALEGENCLYSDSGSTEVSGRADPRYVIGEFETRIAALEAAVVNNV